jgi:pilus assembly protein Flp/PilA
MWAEISKLMNRFRRDEKGVTLVEYGIALVLAIAVGGLLLTNLSTAVGGQLTDAAAVMTGEVTEE